MYINKIRIKNYKSFLDSGQINFSKDIFAFIGQNNTGKSAILDAIQSFFPSSKKSISGVDFHKSTADDIVIEIWFGDVNDLYLIKNLFKDKADKQKSKTDQAFEVYQSDNSEKNKERFDKEEIMLKELIGRELIAAKDKYKIEDEVMYIKMLSHKGGNITSKYYDRNEEEIKEAEIKKIIPEIKVIPALRDPKNESTAGTNSYLKDLIQMLDDEITTEITLEGKPLSYNELNRVLSEETKKRCNKLAEDITGYYNQAIGNNDYKIVIDSSVNISKGTTYNTTITDTVTGVSNDILNCGTGYQSMVILSILETYVQVSQAQTQYILLIEEPEVYLHPTLQRQMIDTLIKISENNQVIFTSHSPITISKLDSNKIRLVEKNNGDATILNISPKKVIDELGIKPDDILYSKGIIFVEGIDDIIVIKELIRKIDSSVVDKINIIQTHSCENLKFYANAELLMNMNFDIPVIILRDADVKKRDVLKNELLKEISLTLLEPQYSSISESDLVQKKERLENSIYVLKEHSIEHYFIEKDYLKEFVSNDEDLEYALNCYECQYRFQLEQAYKGNNQLNNFQNSFQPKRFLEGFPDAKLRDRERKEESLKNKWMSLSKNCDCSNKLKVDNYLKVREEVIKNIRQFSIKGENVFEHVIANNDIDKLKENKIGELIDLLNDFIGKINA